MHQKRLFFISLGERKALEKKIDVPTMFQSVPMCSHVFPITLQFNLYLLAKFKLSYMKYVNIYIIIIKILKEFFFKYLLSQTLIGCFL